MYAIRSYYVRQQFDGYLDNDAQQALGTGQQRKQVITRAVERRAAYREQFPVDGEDFQRLDVVRGEAILEAMHSAGIFRNIAADGTGDL